MAAGTEQVSPCTSLLGHLGTPGLGGCEVEALTTCPESIQEGCIGALNELLVPAVSASFKVAGAGLQAHSDFLPRLQHAAPASDVFGESRDLQTGRICILTQ